MSVNRSEQLAGIQFKAVAAGLRLDSKSLAVDWKRQQADIFVRVLELGRMSLQELAYILGYSDQSAVSRWASAGDRPQWDRIASVPQLAPWIPVAWAEATGADVQTTVIVRRSA